MVNPACSGQCLVENFNLEYQIINLEFVSGKVLVIEAVCYNPFNKYDREAILKFSTTNFSVNDKRLEIALIMVKDLIDKLGLKENKLHKLIVRKSKVFYLYVV